jgi:hypothetical protein
MHITGELPECASCPSNHFINCLRTVQLISLILNVACEDITSMQEALAQGPHTSIIGKYMIISDHWRAGLIVSLACYLSGLVQVLWTPSSSSHQALGLGMSTRIRQFNQRILCRTRVSRLFENGSTHKVTLKPYLQRAPMSSIGSCSPVMTPSIFTGGLTLFRRNFVNTIAVFSKMGMLRN